MEETDMWAADDAPVVLIEHMALELSREQMVERSIVALAVELERHQARFKPI